MTSDDPGSQIDWDELVGPEWAAWYALTPQERWRESRKIFAMYLALGGSPEPEPDPQSPFYDPAEDPPQVGLRFADVDLLRLWWDAKRSSRT